MTIEVSALYRQQWADRIRLRYQARGFQLKGTVAPPIRWEGTKMYFLRSGSLNATKWAGKGHAVNRQLSNDDKVEITSEEWDSPYELYDRDKWLGVPGEEQIRQDQAANALGVTADNIIYSSIMSAALDPEQIIGDYTSGLDPFMLKQAEAVMFDNFTPTDGRVYMPVPAQQFQRLTTYREFQNSEWVGVTDNPRIKASQGRTYGEMNVFQGERTLFDPYKGQVQNLPGGTPGSTAAGIRVRVWHQECIGAGHIAPQEMRNEWKREGDYKRWLVIHTLDGGATVIEPKGIVEFRLKADAPIQQQVMLTRAG